MGKETTSAGQGAVLLTVLGAVSQLLGFASCLIALGILFYQRVFREHSPEELYANRKPAEDTPDEDGKV